MKIFNTILIISLTLYFICFWGYHLLWYPTFKKARTGIKLTKWQKFNVMCCYKCVYVALPCCFIIFLSAIIKFILLFLERARYEN